MPVNQPTVVLDDVHVVYRVYADPRRGLKQLMSGAQGRRRMSEIGAVRGVSLTMYRGETIGLIGSNGSGKSTLMAAMTGLLPIESGSVRVVARPRLLGIGAALRPGVSGRRNILIGGLALGLTRAEVEDRIEDIIDFSGIRDAIDFPMRTYSAGMRARLNFAIATVTSPDILLVDEALAVGDQAFQARSLERINQIREAAGTVVLVTHQLGEIVESCDRAVWLDDGQIRATGDPEAVVEEYVKSNES